MKKMLPPTPALLVMAVIFRHGSAREAEIRGEFAVAFGTEPEAGFLFSTLDSLVQRGWVDRQKGAVGASSDLFTLTRVGELTLLGFHRQFYRMLTGRNPAEAASEAGEGGAA
jgi:hypothetical protein